VTFDLAAESRGLAALLALLLWPGLTVVRAPWTAVPFLSAAFWLLSWWWIPARASRSSFLGAALLFFVLLSLFRVLKPLPSLKPSARTLAVAGLALACVLPWRFLPVAPGLSLASAEATLVVWRDGVPTTYEPLLPVRAFGAHAPGLPLLAADVALLSGLPPFRAVVLVAFVAWGLLVVATYMLLARAGRAHHGPVAGAAMMAALAFAVTQRAPMGPVVLSAALGLAALGLLVPHTERAAAVAAGFLLGAAFTVEATAGLVLAVATARVAGRARAVLALTLAIAFGAQRLGTSLSAWSLAEVRMARAEVRWPGPDRIPDGPALGAMAWLRDQTDPLARVCVVPNGPGRFVPAVALRPAVPAEVPPVYRDEAADGRQSPRCSYRVTFGPLDPPGVASIPQNVPFDPASRVVFRDGTTVVFQEPQL
jgi:hypothetical protein